MEIGTDDANVRIRQAMEYVLSRTGERRHHEMTLAMHFVRTEVSWRLEWIRR